jgi:phytoene dehydrogenase-like protein
MDNAAWPVVIVGGGLSGLAAAVQLGRFGIRTVLFDDAIELGGRARTECRDGFHLNYGPHRLFEGGAAVHLLRRLGVTVNGAARGPNGGLAVWRGRAYTLPVGCCSLLTTGLLGARAKREIARLLAAMPAIDIRALHHVSIGDWLRIHVEDADVIQLMLALVRFTTYGNDPERQSASAALDQLRLSMSGAVLYVHHGWGTLVAALQTAAVAVGAQVVRGCRVVAVNATGGRVTGVMLEDGTSAEARAVIIATGPRPARRLLEGIATIDLPAIPVRVATLDVALQRLPKERVVFALGVDEPWGYSADSVIARLAPQGGAVVHMAKYLPTGTSGTPRDEQQLERALDLLQPGWRDVVVYRRFLPTVVVSHALVTADSGGLSGRASGHLAELENVFLAGDWIGSTGQLADASVASGVHAARAVERIAPSR